MSSLIVEVCKVEEVFKHPNADKLSVAKIKGWNVIIGLNQYKVGDLVVFCPPDSVIPSGLIEKYNLEYLRKDGRVKTVKLRGFISQGLVLDVPSGCKEGDDVSKILGITKYEVPEPIYTKGMKQTSKKKLHPLFDKYTDIENIKNFPDVFKDGDMVVLTEKTHGCLESHTKILLSDGNYKTIEEIVKNKLQLSVLGVNENGEIVNNRIVNWFYNGDTENWLKIKYLRRGFRTFGNYFGTLTCTPNHKIFTNNSYVEAEKLKVGDKINLIKNVDKLSFLQESILTGIMLGDGSIDFNGYLSAHINFGHKKEHEEYVDYILHNLGYIAGNKQKEMMSGYGTVMTRAKTIQSYHIYKLFENWFKDGRKQVPEDIILNPIVLAFLYMDDGSLSHNESQEDRITLATCGFDEKSIDNFIKALFTQMNIVGEKRFTEQKYWRIVFNAVESEKLFILISPYICKCMQYKLPENFKNREFTLYNIGNVEYYNVIREYEITEIKNISVKNRDTNIKKQRYDIETETHNYFANEVLVHNCNGRFANLPIDINKKQPLWYQAISWFKKYILKQNVEWIYGSHNVQISYHNNRNSFYGDDVWGYVAKKYDLKNKLPEGYIFYGEVYGKKDGKGIQDLTYGMDDFDIRFFDIKDTKTGQYLSYDNFKSMIMSLGLNFVPRFYVGEWDKSLIEKYTSGNSLICPTQIREGFVVKSLKEENHPQIGRKILKSVSADYLTRKEGTEYK